MTAICVGDRDMGKQTLTIVLCSLYNMTGHTAIIASRRGDTRGKEAWSLYAYNDNYFR